MKERKKNWKIEKLEKRKKKKNRRERQKEKKKNERNEQKIKERKQKKKKKKKRRRKRWPWTIIVGRGVRPNDEAPAVPTYQCSSGISVAGGVCSLSGAGASCSFFTLRCSGPFTFVAARDLRHWTSRLSSLLLASASLLPLLLHLLHRLLCLCLCVLCVSFGSFFFPA